MADYKKSILKVLQNEGGYVNDPNDNGGETYCGISRKFFPAWLGWILVDAAKHETPFPAILKTKVDLQHLVIDFYKKEFWDKIEGDKIYGDDIAFLLVDSAVNEGIVPAVKRAQVLCGLEATGHVNDELLNALNSLS